MSDVPAGPDTYAALGDRFDWGPANATPNPEHAAWLTANAVGSVLDVGCATGVYVDLLARAGHEAHGADFTASFVDHARRHREGTFHVADAASLPFEDDRFDTVYALDLLEHVADDRTVLREMHRVARQRVLVAIPATTDPDILRSGLLYRHHEDPTHLRTYLEPDVRSLFAEAGLPVPAIVGGGAVDLTHLLRATVRGRRRWSTSFLRRALFKVLRHAQVRSYPTSLLARADLNGPGGGS